MFTVFLKNGVQKKIAEGHPWVYRTQIDRLSWPDEAGNGPEPGDLVDVCDFRLRYLGTGCYNPASMLTVRILSRRHETVDAQMIRQRVINAIQYRQYYRQPDTDSCRLIFAEADNLPGVIADQFADTIVLQILSLGMERWLPVIADTLIAEQKPANLILQHEEPVRAKEGLPLYRQIYLGRDPGLVEIRENGLLLRLDLAGGQKTGCFLDQKANHANLRRYVKDRTVLDCFTYIGGFALNAAAGGAAKVTAVDISEQAIGLARDNAALNHLEEPMEWVVANAFDYLREAVQRKAHYDVIVLDPPAFAKSHAAQAAACRGYKEINLSALRLLEPGGILATHSCSFHMPEPLFIETVLAAARDARRTVRIMDIRRQDFDHPVLAGYPESHYLKSLWLQVTES